MQFDHTNNTELGIGIYQMHCGLSRIFTQIQIDQIQIVFFSSPIFVCVVLLTPNLDCRRFKKNISIGANSFL